MNTNIIESNRSDDDAQISRQLQELAESEDYYVALERREAEKNRAERLRFGRIGRKVLAALREKFTMEPADTDDEEEVDTSLTVGENGERKFEQKLYFSVDLATARRILEAGCYDTTPSMDALPGEEPDKPIPLSSDRFDADGRLVSGFSERQGDATPQVTFILSPDAAKYGSFDQASGQMVADYIPFQECLLGVVTKDPNGSAESIGTMAQGLYTAMSKWKEVAPVFDNASGWWNQPGASPDIEWLNEQKGNVDINRYRREMRKQVFENVDREQADSRTGEFLEEFDEQTMAQIATAYQMAEQNIEQLSPEEREQRWAQAEQRVCWLVSEKLGLNPTPRFEIINDMAKKWAGRYFGQEATVRINSARRKVGDMAESVNIITHELWHARQFQRVLARPADGSDTVAEYYYYNYTNYLNAADGRSTFEGYRGQLLEYEAWTFGEAVRDKMKARLNQADDGLETAA